MIANANDTILDVFFRCTTCSGRLLGIPFGTALHLLVTWRKDEELGTYLLRVRAVIVAPIS